MMKRTAKHKAKKKEKHLFDDVYNELGIKQTPIELSEIRDWSKEGRPVSVARNLSNDAYINEIAVAIGFPIKYPAELSKEKRKGLSKLFDSDDVKVANKSVLQFYFQCCAVFGDYSNHNLVTKPPENRR